MNLIKYTVIASSALIVLSACAPITPFPQYPTQQQPRTPQSSSSMPAGLPPSSSLPSGSPPSGQTSSSSGLPSSQSGNRSSSNRSSSMPGPMGNDSSSSAGGGQSGDASEDGWLDGLPSASASGNGDWQTSNQSIPEGSGTEKSKPGGSGTEDDEPPAAEGDTELAEALSDLDGNILAEREALRKTTGLGNEPEETASDTSQAQGAAQAGAIARARIGTTPPPPKRGDSSNAGDVNDAKDDDIIARQLREAAMQETDPELKEKLWAEYRRYKRG